MEKGLHGTVADEKGVRNLEGTEEVGIARKMRVSEALLRRVSCMRLVLLISSYILRIGLMSDIKNVVLSSNVNDFVVRRVGPGLVKLFYPMSMSLFPMMWLQVCL